MSYWDYLNWGLAVLGIFLTCIFFWVQWRKSAGAVTERQIRANEEILALVTKRLILENYFPSQDDFERLRIGAANKFGVEHRKLIANEFITSTVYFRVLESDLIGPAKRSEILDRLSSKITQLDSDDEPVRTVDIQENVPIYSFLLKTMLKNVSLFESGASSIFFGAAVSVALAGVINVALYREIPDERALNFLFSFASNSFQDLVVPIAAIGSLLMLAVVLLTNQRTLRKREAVHRVSEESVSSSLGRFDVSHWRKIAQSLKGSHFRVLRAYASEYDLMIESNDYKAIIEFKSYGSRLATPLIHQALRRLDVAGKNLGAKEALLVVPKSNFRPSFGSLSEGVARVVTEEMLDSFLEELKKMNPRHSA
tara:strand:- start:265 stop:1368 length:1104 start_codon:yes stop_codon:yes gene_type:complete